MSGQAPQPGTWPLWVKETEKKKNAATSWQVKHALLQTKQPATGWSVATYTQAQTKMLYAK